MKHRYWLFRRNGIYYLQDAQTRREEKLKTALREPGPSRHTSLLSNHSRISTEISSFLLELDRHFAINGRMLMAVAPKKPSANEDLAPARTDASLEAEVIGLFVQLSRMLGQPRSYAEIYGLIFISARPINMEEMIERLGISKGSASQGL